MGASVVAVAVQPQAGKAFQTMCSVLLWRRCEGTVVSRDGCVECRMHPTRPCYGNSEQVKHTIHSTCKMCRIYMFLIGCLFYIVYVFCYSTGLKCIFYP